MKTSIRTIYTLAFTTLLVGAIALILTLNVVFLGRFYTDQQADQMGDIYAHIDTLLEDNTELEDIAGELWAIAEPYNMSILVLKDNRTGIVVGNEQEDNYLITRLRAYAFGDVLDPALRMQFAAEAPMDTEIAETGTETEITAQNSVSDGLVIFGSKVKEGENYNIYKSYDSTLNRQYLEAWGYSGNNYAVLIRTPLDSISNSVAISNQFFVSIGILVIILGAILIWIMTRNITRPILRLTKLSERYSQMDFSERYHGNYYGELNILGDSMNKMSGELEKNIQELRRANAQLEKDLAYKKHMEDQRSDFINSVSHDLKTPIALIQGYAEGLKEGMAEDPESRDYYCDIIMDEANRMNQMVKKLLTLDQLEYDAQAPDVTRFNIKKVIEGLVQPHNMEAEANGVTLACNIHDVDVLADEYMMEEIMNNYLSNAFHHVSGEKMINVSSAIIGRCIRIFVFNTGPRIDENEKDLIWNKFYRSDKSRSRDYGGNGVGLSIVKVIQQHHGNRYGVYNKEDGPVFWFDIALATGSVSTVIEE